MFRYLMFVWMIAFIIGGCNSNSESDVQEEKKKEDLQQKIMLSEEEKTMLYRYLSQDIAEQIDSIFSIYNERYNFNGSVLISKKGNIVYENQFGYSDISNDKKVTPETPFQLASVGKPLTAYAVLQLEEQGRLSLSDSLSCFFPELPYDATVKQLLTHTAGLPNYMWLVENFWDKPYPPYNDDVIEMMASHKLNPHFYSGRRYAYSNTGYIILASIVEEVSGKLFADYMEDEVFKPLGMDNSFVLSAAFNCREDNVAKGYRQNWRGNYKVSLQDLDGPVGDKGIYSTARDLARWQRALDNNELLSSETMAKSYEPLLLKNGNNYPYGLGWRLRLDHEQPYVYHNGLWFGFRSSMHRFVEDNTAFIVLNNTNSKYLNNLLALTRDRLRQDRDYSFAEKVIKKMIEEPGKPIEAYINLPEEDKSQEELTREIKLITEIFSKIDNEELAMKVEETAREMNSIDFASVEEPEDEEQIGGDL